MTWDPGEYLAYADHRTRPAIDLLARIPLRAPRRIADLGCGPGNSTALLAARWPDADILGLDSSPEMLAKARATDLRARWLQADIADWQPDERVDLIYANAVLHWLDGHAMLLPRLISFLAPGGVLAVQMPRNFDAPSHQLLREVAESGPWADRLAATLRRRPVAEPDWYHDLLTEGCRALDIWETSYLHVLEGADPVLRWTRSTAMRPVRDALSGSTLAAFEAAYAARLREAYPARPDGRTLFPFRRLFIVAQARD